MDLETNSEITLLPKTRLTELQWGSSAGCLSSHSTGLTSWTGSPAEQTIIFLSLSAFTQPPASSDDSFLKNKFHVCDWPGVALEHPMLLTVPEQNMDCGHCVPQAEGAWTAIK